jgi:aryl-alcohol dehydrogenase-like predicted oxidoreductase
MNYRVFPRAGWQISEVGYGMWGMAGWSGSADAESIQSLDHALELGCNFFDTAYNYGKGHSEGLLGDLARRHPGKTIYTATKIPPLNFKWPARPDYTVAETYPAGHIREYTEKCLANLGLDSVDLLYFHTWDDSWAADRGWQEAVAGLKRDKLIRSFGISINRWEHMNVVAALRTGLVDAVQVVYNLFDQAPEFELFPICAELKVAVIARVPFDEGSLTGTLTPESQWPEGDFRAHYFKGGNLAECVARAESVKKLLPEGMTLPELALRFILASPAVTSVIPGMRKSKHVEENLGISDGRKLPPEFIEQLRKERWDRVPGVWI